MVLSFVLDRVFCLRCVFVIGFSRAGDVFVRVFVDGGRLYFFRLRRSF